MVITIGCAWIAGHAGAQQPVDVLEARAGEPQPSIRARDLAQLVGASLSEEGGVLVLRTDDVALTVFAGSADVVVADDRALETALSAPARREDGTWWLPLDAGAPFGVQRVSDDRVTNAAGRSWRLVVAQPAEAAPDARATLLEPAPGVVALEVLERAAVDGPSDRAVWIADLALVPLLAPELRSLVDDALRDAGAARALLLVATSRAAGASFEGITVDVEGRRVVEAGSRHLTLSGDADEVGPQAPWIAVVWLPPGTRLDRPLRIGWEGAFAHVTLRN